MVGQQIEGVEQTEEVGSLQLELQHLQVLQMGEVGQTEGGHRVPFVVLQGVEIEQLALELEVEVRVVEVVQQQQQEGVEPLPRWDMVAAGGADSWPREEVAWGCAPGIGPVPVVPAAPSASASASVSEPPSLPFL